MPTRPKRKLGQNFLCDENILHKIVELIHPSPADTILEIGAGTGALTKHLAPLVSRLIAVELDGGLLSYLQQIPSVEVIHGDILKLDVCGLVASGKIRLVGNLPYYISTPIATALIRQRPCIQDMVLMFQEEVAQRIIAFPSHGDYSYLSALCQYFCRIEKGFRVSRNCFRPRPDVQSRILRFEFHPETAFDYDQYSAFLSTAFTQRRKKLVKNLTHSLSMDTEQVLSVFRKLSISENVRAENLSPQQFESLLHELSTRTAGE